MSEFKHECDEKSALKFWDWLNNRGGIAVWKSVNLGNPSASWSTPATIRRGDCDGAQASKGSPDDILPYPKPTWQAGNVPEIIADPKEVGVFTSALYKAFKVGLKRGDGFSFILTDAANKKVKRLLAECKEKHGDSFYKKGVLDIEGASIGIYYTTGIIPIAEWIEKNAPSPPDQGAGPKQ